MRVATAARVSRFVLAMFLGLTCIAKLWSGHQSHYAISRTVFIVTICVEGCLAVGLLLRSVHRPASVGTALVAAAGIAIEFYSGGKTCGCLGSLVKLTSAEHILLNATVGAMAVIVWHGSAVSESPDEGE